MAKSKDGMDDLLKEALEVFELCEEVEAENRADALDDVRFARLGEQWPEEIKQKREKAGRPCRTINVLPPFIRQVVNEARQNRPSIKVHPADDGADQEVAEIYNGLIRNIEVTSDADVAYDTALEHAVDRGLGYFRINTDYCGDDSFELDLCIRAIMDPFSVYGDPFSTAADSADWDQSFIVESMRKKDFERKYKGADAVDWDLDYVNLAAPWMSEDMVQLAEFWKREEAERLIVALSSGDIIDLKEFEKNLALFQAAGAEVVGRPRPVKTYKVTQHILTGAEVLESNPWAGKYIPIVPVYGEVVMFEGKRRLRSLIRDAKDPVRDRNVFRSLAVETLALAPKAPFIGPKGAFRTDADKWTTANAENHAYIEYDVANVPGAAPPQRQPYAGVPEGAIQAALTADNDLKAVIGMHEASLGQEGGPEQSGRAILARMREGDVSTFHFTDNLSRAIRHAGRILIDLIPTVYSTPRILRVLGPDQKPSTVAVNQPSQVQQLGPDGKPAMQPQQDATGATIMQPVVLEKFYDLSAGKYDLTVAAGPSFTTKREEAANQMIELIRAFPQAAPALGGLVAKNLDWEGADQVAELLAPLAQQQGGGNDGQAKAQADAAAKQQELQQNHQFAMLQLQQEGELQRAKLTMQMQLEREKLQQTMALKREQAEMEAQLATDTARMGAAIKLAEATNHQDQTTELPTTTIGGNFG